MANGGADKGKVIAGVFIGMVLGITAAVGIAWYMLEKNPSAFTKKGQAKSTPLPANPPVALLGTPPVAASGVEETKQHFEFYRVLTDKPDAAARRGSAAKPKETADVKPQPAPSKEIYYVQAGAFQNMDDAEKLKAKLAFSGFEANIQTADIPDKGVWHRVRLGPYNGSEAGKTVSALKLNGIIATQIRAQ